jgi:hypothetical protein
MTIEIAGASWNLLAVTIFLIANFLGTQIFKKRICLHPVFISWIVGLPIMMAVAFIWKGQLTFWSWIQFFFLTLLLNGSIKGGTLAYDFMASKFTFLKERERVLQRRRQEIQ